MKKEEKGAGIATAATENGESFIQESALLMNIESAGYLFPILHI